MKSSKVLSKALVKSLREDDLWEAPVVDRWDMGAFHIRDKIEIKNCFVITVKIGNERVHLYGLNRFRVQRELNRLQKAYLENLKRLLIAKLSSDD